MTTEPDGNIWFSDPRSARLGRIHLPEVAVTFIDLRMAVDESSEPMGLTLDQAGNIWFANSDNGQIVRMTQAGTFTIYHLPVTDQC